jgi:hypothetical protein
MYEEVWPWHDDGWPLTSKVGPQATEPSQHKENIVDALKALLLAP